MALPSILPAIGLETYSGRYSRAAEQRCTSENRPYISYCMRRCAVWLAKQPRTSDVHTNGRITTGRPTSHAHSARIGRVKGQRDVTARSVLGDCSCGMHSHAALTARNKWLVVGDACMSVCLAITHPANSRHMNTSADRLCDFFSFAVHFGRALEQG